MNQIITNPSIRIKITGLCNRSCSFCNEEGDMRTIGSIEPNEEFFKCVHTLAEMLKIKQIMLTGGEPTIHPSLHQIVSGIDAPEISITTNGIRPLSTQEWTGLKNAGLSRVIFSIHDATPQSIIKLETRGRVFSWAVRSIESQKHNLECASQAGLRVRVNTVAYHSREHVREVLDVLEHLQNKHKFDIRLLSDLSDIEKSHQIIKDVCTESGATVIKEERRAGSSNTVTLWETESGFRFSTKMAYRYFFDPICKDCQIKQQCHEGFYGIRIEQRASDYWVRLCLYKHTPDVLMPWKSFLESELPKKLKDLCKLEQS